MQFLNYMSLGCRKNVIKLVKMLEAYLKWSRSIIELDSEIAQSGKRYA